MTSKIRSIRVSPAMIVSCVALFLALTGSALAVGLAKNSVRSAQIANGTVRTVDLRDNSVKTPKDRARRRSAKTSSPKTRSTPPRSKTSR